MSEVMDGRFVLRDLVGKTDCSELLVEDLSGVLHGARPRRHV